MDWQIHNDNRNKYIELTLVQPVKHYHPSYYTASIYKFQNNGPSREDEGSAGNGLVSEIFLIFFHSAFDLEIAHNSKITILIQRKAMFAENLQCQSLTAISKPWVTFIDSNSPPLPLDWGH